MTAATLKQWAERLCRVTATDAAQLSAAIDGADKKWPAGVTNVEVDDREVGLGGIWLRFAPGTIARRQFEATFGDGEMLAGMEAGQPIKVMSTVESTGAPHRCSVIVEYRAGDADGDVRGVYLRVDRGRA